MTSMELQYPQVANQHQNSYRLMLFDLSIYGHHPSYIKYLLQYWHQKELPGQLVVLVSPRFLEAHCDVVELAQQLDPENIQFCAITVSEEAALKSRSTSIGRNLRNFQEWRLLCKYARSLRVDHVLTMYYDTYQNPILLNQMPHCPMSGIYFRPKFHYRDFRTASPQMKPTVREWWAKFLLERVLSKPKLHRLFSLDPFVMDHITPRWRDKVIYLPDPIELTESSTDAAAALRKRFDIAPHRKVFLLFGALTERKGIYELLEAIPKLSPELTQQSAFIFLGESSPAHREKIDPAIEHLCQLYPVQIIRHYE
ncbi:MAG: glycosyltransferase family 1 protein, partial [Thermosynechococcaceae cyanobacterium]